MALSSPSRGAVDAAPLSPQPEKPNQAATDQDSSWAQAGEILLLVGQRLLLGALVLLAIIFFSFLGLELATGAPLLETLTTASVATVRYVQGLLHGDLGLGTAATSINNPIPVTSFLWEVFARSLALLGLALLIASVVGCALGLYAATRKNANRSLPLLLVSIIGVSMPSFFVAMLLQMVVIRWTRATGNALLPVGGFGWDTHMILPAIVLAARPIAQITRVTFVSARQTLREDYVRTARSKGLREYRVIFEHVIRNIGVPVLTTIGVSLRFSLSSLPVVELFFGWPGAGFTMLKAIASGDTNTTLALLLCFGLLFILVNLLLEILYLFVDPRLRGLGRRAATDNRQAIGAALADSGRSIRNATIGIFNGRWWAGLRAFASRMTSRAYWRDSNIGANREPANWRLWRRGLAGNIPLFLGLLILGGLLALYLFGARLVPHSPYTTQGLEYVDGEFRVPPFAPDDIYPWGTDVLGRDMLSLVLAGAQQTLSLAALVVLARMVIGFVLGALSGWFNGSWLDRAIQSVAEVIAAFPTLLLAMLLILSLGIRGGFRPFLIGMSLVGWSEVMQFVRGEVMSIRPRLFIESAVAIGARTTRIVWHHVVPNLLPALISLAALEMGAVLMLLGELGFIGVFIGGGAFAELQIAAPPYHYSDVPEWGSLLSNVRTYARAYPWTAIYPATAFFIAILGFNLLGEGLRRLVEDVGAQFTRIWNRYTFAAIIVLLLATGWVRANTGPTAFYRQQANQFDAAAAVANIETLAQESWSGRALGEPGREAAANHIADQFAALGLQPGGVGNSYFVPHQREYERITATPEFTINDGGVAPVYRQDFAEFVGIFSNMGEIDGPVHLLATGFLDNQAGGNSSLLPRPIRNLDFSDGVLMALSAEDAIGFSRLPAGGMLVVTDDPALLARRATMPARDPVITSFGGQSTGQQAPVLWISEAMADRILAASGRTVAELRRTAAELIPEEVLTFDTGTAAHLRVEGEIVENVETAHIIGHLPATQGQNLGGNLIMVTAQYDAPPVGPDGVYAGANDNGSGVALMLEAIRTLQESEYRPYKTFLFVAYSGEGTEKGVPAYPPDVEAFMHAKSSFVGNFELEAVVDLRGVAGGDGDQLVIEAGGSLRLADLLETTATRTGVQTVRAGDPVDISVIFDRSQTRTGGQDAPTVGVRWAGWEATARTAFDTTAQIDDAKMTQAGRAVALLLMVLGRETNY